MNRYEQLVLDIIKCLNLVHKDLKYNTVYESLIWNKLIPLLMEKLAKDISERRNIDIAFDLKLIIESAIQATYLLLKHKFNEINIKRELSRRTKTASIFTAKMIAELPNTPGPIKKQILNIYLKISEYTHPTLRIMERISAMITLSDLDPDIRELIKETVDLTMYLLLRLYKEQVSALTLSILNNLSYTYGLNRTKKYLSK